MKQRLHTLDYLRGIAAFSIMIYHFSQYAYGEHSSDSVLGRMGVYCVSIFYILSGLTLFLVYNKSMKPTVYDVKDFTLKRVFRIFPLLWLVTVATIVLRRELPYADVLALNLTGLFGFVRWEEAIANGGWSIGNELVFYAFFPLFIYLIKKRRQWFWIFVTGLLTLYGGFAFYLLTPSKSLIQQWVTYVNPLNQVLLFASGVAMGLLFKKVSFRPRHAAILLATACLLFVLYPATGNQITLVVGWDRLIFTFIAFVICLGFFKLQVSLPVLIHRPLTMLGEASYSVYLIHQLVWSALTGALTVTGVALSPLIKLPLAVLITVAVSYPVYIYFEKYFISLGRKVSVRILEKNVSTVVMEEAKAA